MYIADGGSLVLKRVQFTSNTNALHVSSMGDASAPVLLTSVTFTRNWKGLQFASSVAALRHVQFEENQYYAMHTYGSSSAQLDTVSFARNSGYTFFTESSAGKILMTFVTFTENQGSGATLYARLGDVTATNLMFYDNSPYDTSKVGNNLECKVDACAHGTTEATEPDMIYFQSECASCSPCDALRMGLVTMCSSCDAGFYSFKNSSTSECLDCGSGNRSFSGSNSSCTLTECPAGSYGPLGSSACAICQNGYATYTAGLTVCSRCKFEAWCPTNGLCIEGHTGVGCAECESNWYMKSNTCQQCPENAVGTFALTLVVVSFMLYLLYKLAGAEEDDDIQSEAEEEVVAAISTAVAKFNVSLSFFQITTTILFLFQLEFPADLLNWLSWIAFTLSINFGELGRPECSLKTSMGFASRWSVSTFAPIGLMVPFLVLAAYSKERRSQAIATIALIGTTTYVPVVGSAASVWRCEDTDYGDSVLATAPSINCDGSGSYYGILCGSAAISFLYFSGVHFLVPFYLAKKEGFGKVKRIYVQDFDKGKKWWFHVSLGYKLATLLVAALVVDATQQLSLMLFFSLAMTMMCFIFRPHITKDKLRSKYWNEKCTQGCCSLWSEFDGEQRSAFKQSQFTSFVIIPASLSLWYFIFGGNLFDMLLVALFIILFDLVLIVLACCYPYVIPGGGFSPNAVETGLHFLETLIVFISFLYQVASEKLEHPNKELDDDATITGDDEYYDHNGDFRSFDERLLEFGISFVYLVGFALVLFEVAAAYISNPLKYIKDWCAEKVADDPFIGRARQIMGIFGKETDLKAEDTANQQLYPHLQSVDCNNGGVIISNAENGSSQQDIFEVELVETIDLKGTSI